MYDHNCISFTAAVSGKTTPTYNWLIMLVNTGGSKSRETENN